FLGRALAYAGLGNYAAAVGEYNHALRVKPNDAVLLTARGSAYLVLGDLEWARKDFTEAIRLDPRNATAHNGRGYALVKLGKSFEGVREAQTALELGHPTPSLFYNAARVFAQASALEAIAEQSSRSPGGWSAVYREEAMKSLARALPLVKEEKRAD